MKEVECGSEEGKRAAGLGSVLEIFSAKGYLAARQPAWGHWEPGKS